MKKLALLVPTLFALACGSADPPPPSGGVLLPARVGTCARGWAVVSSDYASTSIAILSQDGTTLSGSMLSSAAPASGASAALSGDVVVAREWPPASDPDVLFVVDRYPNAVVTRVALGTGDVVAQRSVATGFASNPHDLLALGDGRAYVARYGTNPKPGREPLDGGSDLLIVDAKTLAPLGRVDLAGAGGNLPARPDRLIRAAPYVVALLGRIDTAFKDAADGRLAALDPKADALTFTTDLTGVANCGALSLSQDGTTIAVTCSGVFADGPTQLDRSDVVLVDATKSPFSMTQRLAVAKPLGAALAPAIAWDEGRLVGIAYGSNDSTNPRGDVLWTVTPGGAPVVIATASKAFVLGDVVCSACSKQCLVTDASNGTVRRFRWSGTAYEELVPTKIDGAVGLPPRTFGAL
jgi:hypothetical protein